MRDEYLEGIMSRNNSKDNMAKKTKTEGQAAPAAGATGAAAPAADKNLDRGGDDVFAPVFENGKPKEPTTKLAPQAKVIISAIVAAGKGGIKRKDLVPKLVPAGLQTKQPPGRILSYYQKDIVASGAVTHTKAAPTPAPAAAPAAPAAA